MIDKVRRNYGAFTASCDYRTVAKFSRNASRAFTLEYCTKTAVYGATFEQNARFDSFTSHESDTKNEGLGLSGN